MDAKTHSETDLRATHHGRVEDDPLVRSYVIAQLQGLGYRTREAVNAADASVRAPLSLAWCATSSGSAPEVPDSTRAASRWRTPRRPSCTWKAAW